MNRLAVLTLVILMATAASSARAAVAITWDCFLADSEPTCVEIETAFFSNAAYVRADPGVSVATLKLRAVRAADGVNYSVDVSGSEGQKVSFVDRVPRNFAEDAVLMRVIGDLQKGMAPWFVVERPAELEGGVVPLKLQPPGLGPRNGRSDDETTGWYIAPGVNFEVSRFGIFNLSTSANVDVNWSHPHWRLRNWNWASYRLVLADPVTGDEDPDDLRWDNVDWGTDWTVVRTIHEGFSFAANAYALRDPRNNYLLRSGSWVGAEWVLVPFLKTDEGNFGAQYVIGAEHHTYQRPAVENRLSYDYLRHRARVFATWHFTRVDVDGGVTAVAPVIDPRFISVTGNASVTWRIVDDLWLEVQGEASYRNALLNAPKDLSDLHPLEQFFGGGNFGDVNFWSWVGLRYVFGNSLTQRQDQRWR